MTLPTFLSARAWPGLRPWLASVFGSVAIFELLGVFAWRIERGNLPDFTSALVTVPVATMLAILIAAALLAFLARVPFAGGLSFAARLLPLIWIFPLFDLVRSVGRGFVIGIPTIDGNGYLLSLATGGLLPLDTGITVGMRLGMFAGAVVTGLIVWHLTKIAWKTLVAALVMSAAFTKLVYFASAMGLWYRLTHPSAEFIPSVAEGLGTGSLGWVASPDGVTRSILLAVTNGYWWSNIYERFPTAVDMQSAIALRLTTAGILATALGVVLALVFIWQIPAWKRICLHTFRSWSAFDLALYVAGGGILYAVLIQTPLSVRIGWFAPVAALLMLAALRLASALQRSLHFLSRDERANADQPVARGDLLPDTAKDVVAISLLYVLAVSWVLGWPVFATILVYLAASHLTRDRSWSAWPWLSSIFRSLGAAVLSLSGVFFVSQSNKLAAAAVIISGLAAAHRLAVEFLWIPWKSRR